MRKLLYTLGLLTIALNTHAIQSPELPTYLSLEIGWQKNLPVNAPWWGESDRDNHYAIGTGDQAPTGIPSDLYYLEIWDDLSVIESHTGGSINPFLPVGFRIEFPDYPVRSAATAIVNAHGGTYTITHDDSDWGSILFEWGTPPNPQVVGVPDAGSTVGLLSLALGGMAIGRSGGVWKRLRASHQNK